MPSKSKQQQKFMGIVRSIQKGEAPAGKFSKAAQKAAKSMEKGSVRKYAKTKHDDLPVKKEAYDFKKAHKKFKETGELPPHLKKMVKDLDKMEKKYKVKNIVVPGLEWMSKIKEERDYKDEYNKFQSSTKSKKYRAELNKYNRKKGTYGNGDGKDASHKGGKIVGFESQSKNRGRAEKSRLKKESVLNENPAAIAAGVRAAMARAKEKELSAGGGKKVKVSTALANKSHPKHKQAKGIIQRIKDKAKSMLSKSKKKKAEPKKQSKSDTNFYARQFGGTSESVDERMPAGKQKLVYQFKRLSTSEMDELDAMLSRAGIVGTPDFNKKTWSTYANRDAMKLKRNKTLQKFIKRKGGVQIEEGFGGELKGSDKKKFEDDRKKNGEQLGYTLTGTSDVKETLKKVVKEEVSNIISERMDKRQAGETLKQLGGNKFIAMTGAKNFAVGPKGMGFKIGRNSKSINYIRIDLKSTDLYDMEFIRLRGSKINVVKKVTGVYNDQLQKMFTKHTGMYTSL